MTLVVPNVWGTLAVHLLLTGILAASTQAFADDGPSAIDAGASETSEVPADTASASEDWLDYRASFGATGAIGFGIPADNPVLYSRDTQMVSGFAIAPPTWSLQVGIRLGERWELIPTLTLQSIFVSSGVYAEWGGELRARTYFGTDEGRWNGFFQFGAGFGRVVHLVRLNDSVVQNGELVAVKDLDRSEAGPFRVLAGVGGRYNVSKLFAVDVFGTAYGLFPETSFNLDIGVGLIFRI